MGMTEDILKKAAEEYAKYAKDIEVGGVRGDLPDGNHVVDITDFQVELTEQGTARCHILLKVVGGDLNGKEGDDTFMFPLDLKSMQKADRAKSATGLSVFDQKYATITRGDRLIGTGPKEEALKKLLGLISTGEAKKNMVGKRMQINVTHKAGRDGRAWPRISYKTEVGEGGSVAGEISSSDF